MESNNSSQSNLNIFMIMFGFTFFSGSMLVGRELIDLMPISVCILCILLGGCILGIFGGLLAYISCKKKSSMEELLIQAFGTRGSYIPSLLISITQIGWYGVGISMFAVPVSSMIAPHNKGILFFLIIVFGAIMTYSTQHGLHSITMLSYIAVPVISLFGIAIIIVAFANNPSMIVVEQGYYDWSQRSAIITGVELVVGSYISGSITTPNFTKDGEKPLEVAIISFLAFCIGNGLMIVFGAISRILVGGSDIFDLFVHFNCKKLGIAVLGLNIWSSCDNGLYSAGLSIQSITKIKLKNVIIAAGILSTLFSLSLYNHFVGFLSIMNRFLPPVGVVLILNYILPRKGKECFYLPSIFAMVSGCIAAIIINIGVPLVNASITTVLVYLLVRNLCNLLYANNVD